MAFHLPEFKTIVIGFIGSFFLIEILSLFITAMFPSVPTLKGGSALLLILVAVGVIALFNVSFSVEKLKSKENLVFLIVIFGLIFVAFYFGPTYFPTLFSISPVSNSLHQVMGAIFGG